MSDEKNYTNAQMKKIADELNLMQSSYDTRLLAALLIGRGAMLHANLVTAEIITHEEAVRVWNYAGEILKNPENRREVKVVKLYGDETINLTGIN